MHLSVRSELETAALSVSARQSRIDGRHRSSAEHCLAARIPLGVTQAPAQLKSPLSRETDRMKRRPFQLDIDEQNARALVAENGGRRGRSVSAFLTDVLPDGISRRA